MVTPYVQFSVSSVFFYILERAQLILKSTNPFCKVSMIQRGDLQQTYQWKAENKNIFAEPMLLRKQNSLIHHE